MTAEFDANDVAAVLSVLPWQWLLTPAQLAEILHLTADALTAAANAPKEQ